MNWLLKLYTMKYLINKQLKGLIGLFMASAFFVSCSSENQIDSSSSQAEIAQAINESRWTFTANSASPAYGNFRTLTGGYYVKCQKDTMIVSLPYYGKLNSPAGALEGNPLDFKSTEFTLTKEDKKSGEWLVTINRPDREVQAMNFTFFDNGSAQLTITMTNRTGISFSGKVAPSK